jgi:2-hydroxychromene-2-carboxylate isomerase
MPKKLEFFYDCSSPWTYLAFTKIEDLALRHDAQLIWRPILVGGLFNTVNPSVYESRAKPVPVKAKYYVKDLRDWAKFYGIKIGNPTVFPVNSVKAMRGALIADEHRVISRYSRRVFESYWTDDKDISQDDVLREIVKEAGLDEKEFFTKIASAEYKARLRFRLAHDVRRRLDVLRQRPAATGRARAGGRRRRRFGPGIGWVNLISIG